ncbi:DUF6668 family protein [Arthrobacter sp. RCC_34]|uniref:DUF6668 family protein n=1 Tax=Arthrobacter sp. RCC_34 TaxID=3239230 RepID=UPI00352347A4
MSAQTTRSASKWLKALEEPSTAPVEAPVVRDTPTGPKRPQKGVRWESEAGVPRLPVSGPAPAVWVMGAHGGAGESTIAKLLDGAVATDHAWPVREDDGGPDQVLMVCRSNAAGLRAAQRAAIEFNAASAGLPGSLAGLVVMADAPGRLPKPLATQMRLVAGAVPHLWFMPWVEAWRTSTDLDAAALPSAARSVLEKIQLHTAVGDH